MNQSEKNAVIIGIVILIMLLLFFMPIGASSLYDQSVLFINSTFDLSQYAKLFHDVEFNDTTVKNITVKERILDKGNMSFVNDDVDGIVHWDIKFNDEVSGSNVWRLRVLDPSDNIIWLMVYNRDTETMYMRSEDTFTLDTPNDPPFLSYSETDGITRLAGDKVRVDQDEYNKNAFLELTTESTTYDGYIRVGIDTDLDRFEWFYDMGDDDIELRLASQKEYEWTNGWFAPYYDGGADLGTVLTNNWQNMFIQGIWWKDFTNLIYVTDGDNDGTGFILNPAARPATTWYSSDKKAGATGTVYCTGLQRAEINYSDGLIYEAGCR